MISFSVFRCYNHNYTLGFSLLFLSKNHLNMIGIEALCLRSLVSSVHGTYLCGSCPRISVQPARICVPTHRPFVSCSKPSNYQDFQGYERPLRLLPTSEPNICTHSSLVETSTSLREDSQAIYVVKLYTSPMFGSGLSDLSSGVLLCLIDENGDSVLQRISASPAGIPVEGNLDLCFQRGSIDELIFKGPKLGRIQALWVGLESGRWRLGGVSLTVLHGHQAPSDNTEKDSGVDQKSGFQYVFDVEDILVGEVDSMSMVELKPCQVIELCAVDLFNLPNTSISESTSLINREVSNQESMKEYADLKTSLLLYDSLLIFVGTTITTISTGEKAGWSFLSGGTVGFLYLLLLQKSVDELPAPESVSTNRDGENINQLLKRVKGPISTLVLAVAFAGVAVKFGLYATPMVLTPQEILAGMAGFLACKVAVLLAAFKPVQIKLKENK